MEDELIRSTTLTLDIDQIHVAKEGVQDEGDGQHHGMIRWQIGCREGVQRVGHCRAGRNHADHVIKKGYIVLIEDAAVGIGVGFEQDQFVPTLADGNE